MPLDLQKRQLACVRPAETYRRHVSLPREEHNRALLGQRFSRREAERFHRLRSQRDFRSGIVQAHSRAQQCPLRPAPNGKPACLILTLKASSVLQALQVILTVNQMRR